MEFLDPKKRRAHTIRLMVGYVLVAIALILTTIVLLYQAYGFGVDRNGQVIQSGLVFVSSTPNPANIYVNGKLKDTTNTRLNLPAGQYTFEVQREGYHQWKRAITVEGGSVEHFDYPFLVPSKLTTNNIKKYTEQPGLSLQSPDRRWLLVRSPSGSIKFDVFDLKDDKPAETMKSISLPENLLGATSGTWELGEWSTDNRHVLLKHLYQKDDHAASEYIVLDREKPAESVNLSKTLGINPSRIELRDKKYDQYYVFDQGAGTLSTASLKEPTPKPYLTHVLDFKSHGKDVMLYATNKDAPAGKAVITLREGEDDYTIRQVTAGAKYMLNLTQYSGDWYVAAGAPSENKTYVYKNPVGMLKEKPKEVLVPVNILKVVNPAHVAFSDNARFIMAQQGDNFAVYDAENDKGYTYSTKLPLDAPQTHATWMDGHRITYVSNGKVVFFDFDSTNLHTLVATSPADLPVFDQNYEFIYTLTKQTTGDPAQFLLNSTSLRTPQDQ